MQTDFIKCGNSAELLKDLPESSIDLVVTSPPYDNLREYKGYSFDFETIAKELYRVTKQGGVIVWIVADGVENGSETGNSFRQALFFKEIGFNIHDTMIWLKNSSAFPELVRYSQVFEYMFILSKGKPKTFNPIKDRINVTAGSKVHGTRRQKDGTLKKVTHCSTLEPFGARFNVWSIPCETCNDTGHPAVFPAQLARDHILTWSNKGDVVLDCFLGSGTTALEAYKLERHYVGFEISQEYFNIASERLKLEKSQVNIFDILE